MSYSFIMHSEFMLYGLRDCLMSQMKSNYLLCVLFKIRSLRISFYNLAKLQMVCSVMESSISFLGQ